MTRIGRPLPPQRTAATASVTAQGPKKAPASASQKGADAEPPVSSEALLSDRVVEQVLAANSIALDRDATVETAFKAFLRYALKRELAGLKLSDARLNLLVDSTAARMEADPLLKDGMARAGQLILQGLRSKE